MIVLMIYLSGAFLTFVGLFLLNWANKGKVNKGIVGYLLVLVSIWPISGLLALKETLIDGPKRVKRCGWCNQLYGSSREEFMAHIMECKDHPMHSQLDALRAENNRLRELAGREREMPY